MLTDSDLVEVLSIKTFEFAIGPTAQGHLSDSPEHSCALPQQTVQSFGELEVAAEAAAGGIIGSDWVY